MTSLFFLKLGGSLITDKNTAHTARGEVLAHLAQEIQAALVAQPDLRLVIGHGSGSFGHVAARKHGTRGGVQTLPQWLGFSEVWYEARALNQIVIEKLAAARLPVIAMPPSATIIARDGQIESWDLAPIHAALEAGLVPVINGDTIFDTLRGGTILSTEELFLYLARQLHPQRILLAGIERGVWADFPACTQSIDQITPGNYSQVAHRLGGSAAVDVTGGMLTKVRTMLDLVQEQPELEVLIFSGLQPGQLKQVLLGSTSGTLITGG
jgi:isopentenyl phosphate kinase